MLLSIEELRALSPMDPELAHMFAKGASQLSGMVKGWDKDSDIVTIRHAINMVNGIRHASRPPASSLPYRVREVEVPLRPREGDAAAHTTTLRGRVYRPRRLPQSGCPLLFFCRGGDYMVDGGPLSHLWLCELFATYGGVAVEVQFRLAPEHVFPTAVLDAYDGLKWTAENYVSLGANPSKGFIVAGESTGADIALVIAHLYADEARRPALTGLYVACPHAMEPDTVPDQYRDRFVSREQNADAFILKADSIEFIKSMYKPDTKSSLFHAVNFPDHSKMPKTYFQACGADPTRDGVLILDQLWRDCGVETKIDVYPGLPHHFWTLFIHARFTQKHAEDSQRALSWLLGSESGWGPKKPKPGETTEGEASA